MLVSQTSWVSGASKSISSACSYRALVIAELTAYEMNEASTMTMRMVKIQTSSCT